jgi:hypothetical protein
MSLVPSLSRNNPGDKLYPIVAIVLHALILSLRLQSSTALLYQDSKTARGEGLDISTHIQLSGATHTDLGHSAEPVTEVI